MEGRVLWGIRGGFRGRDVAWAWHRVDMLGIKSRLSNAMECTVAAIVFVGMMPAFGPQPSKVKGGWHHAHARMQACNGLCHGCSLSLRLVERIKLRLPHTVDEHLPDTPACSQEPTTCNFTQRQGPVMRFGISQVRYCKTRSTES